LGFTFIVWANRGIGKSARHRVPGVARETHVGEAADMKRDRNIAVMALEARPRNFRLDISFRIAANPGGREIIKASVVPWPHEPTPFPMRKDHAGKMAHRRRPEK
jgi:hypothetical protein